MTYVFCYACGRMVPAVQVQNLPGHQVQYIGWCKSNERHQQDMSTFFLVPEEKS